MSVIYLLIPLSIALAAGFLVAFVWAVRSGQYEDTGTPPLRLLTDRSATKPLLKIPVDPRATEKP